MSTFFALSAITFSALLLLIAVLCTRYYVRYFVGGSIAAGQVVEMHARDWADDEGYAAQRYFGTVAYAVNGTDHFLKDWGPHVIAIDLGTRLEVRYRRADPGDAIVPLKGREGSPWQFVLLFLFCLGLAIAACRAWLATSGG